MPDRPRTRSTVEKGGAGVEGLSLLLCENPLSPLDEAIAAARAELSRANHYIEPHSAPLRDLLAERAGVPVEHLYVNAGSELILRQLFDRFGGRVHLLTPTYPLFTEIAARYTETQLRPDDEFQFDLRDLSVPDGTTLVVLVNPNNPNGAALDITVLPDLLAAHPERRFLVDEAFVDFVDGSVAHLVPEYENLLVTRTLSKPHSLAGFRVGYAVLPEVVAADLRALGVRTFTPETYFFLADFAPHDAADLTATLTERGSTSRRSTTTDSDLATFESRHGAPAENERLVTALEDLLCPPSAL